MDDSEQERQIREALARQRYNAGFPGGHAQPEIRADVAHSPIPVTMQGFDQNREDREIPDPPGRV